LTLGKQYVAVRLRWPVFDFLRHVAQIDRPATVDSDHDLLQILGTSEEQSGFHLKLAIVAREAAGLSARVRGLQLTDNRSRRKPIRR